MTSALLNVGNMDYPTCRSAPTSCMLASMRLDLGCSSFECRSRNCRAGQAVSDINFTNPSDSSTAYGAHLAEHWQRAVLGRPCPNQQAARLQLARGLRPIRLARHRYRQLAEHRLHIDLSGPKLTGSTSWRASGQCGDQGHASLAGGLFGGPESEVLFRLDRSARRRFAHPHIRIAQVDTSNYSVKEWQIWNPDHAFAYPGLATNSSQEVGISLGWGGGDKFFANHAVGILHDFVVWYSELSDAAINRWGDYVTVRRANPKTSLFAAVGYSLLNNPPPATSAV